MTGRNRTGRQTVRRRSFLAAAAGAASVGLAGCSGLLETRSTRSPPLVEGRPDAVYVPSHIEGMHMAGMASAGPYRVALSYSYPHRFWLVTGTDVERVDIESDDTVHLMATVWDRETGVVIPTSSVTLEVARDGETAYDRPPWPMLSQNMGVHLGDNAALPGDGEYTATVGVDPLAARATGAFEGRFDEPATADIEFEFSRATLEEVPYRMLDERKGERDAVDPMTMEMVPSGQLPPAAELPGRLLGEATSGDGRFVSTALSAPPAGVEGSGAYLAVSAQSPYNRYPLPFVGLSARVDRGGERVFDGPLTGTLDPGLGYHYGAAVESIEVGDVLTLEFGAPPQVARHEGYETAFVDLATATIDAR